jgi:hypothetical protein
MTKRNACHADSAIIVEYGLCLGSGCWAEMFLTWLLKQKSSSKWLKNSRWVGIMVGLILLLGQ